MAIFRYWRHFLALEDDFAKTLRYVEFAEANYKTYSVEFVKLLLAIGSEVDVAAKDVCRALDKTKKYGSIDKYRECISVRNIIFNEKVLVPRYERVFQPWKAWHGEKSPDWWKAYNDVKHERNAYLHDANLENVANALAGLFVMIMYCHKAEKSVEQIDPRSQLFDLELKLAHKPTKKPKDLYLPPYYVHSFATTPFDKSKVPLE